ncbi:GSCFA domain-containing protein [uncultured Polaribacter sp.]|uniref:GSCFA domain-containing protein n=1 Tax=uncultured Polaribacter sp. TaxID=174711 RepID=UPI002635BFEC|nr:GSCFA domain-containing protein [uncultured Polaribacter sp.]
MKLQTQLTLKKQTEKQISYQSKILLLGSCFSENIGSKLHYYKFDTTINPFGILFHPKAIETFITKAISKTETKESELVFSNEFWHSFNAHSSFRNSDKTELSKNLNLILADTFKELTTTSHVVITLGTAWVYRFLESKQLVANCHKIPQKNFTKELLSIEEVTTSLQKIISLLKSINKDINVIFTVSPIRHLKDGFIENTLSKSHLISGIHKTINTVTKNVFYFPSYEIMMDELRDYRFYKEDMLHPNKVAINYIWEKFVATWVTTSAEKTMLKVDTIQKGLIHKPFNPNSEQHQKFLKHLKAKILELEQEMPTIDFHLNEK